MKLDLCTESWKHTFVQFYNIHKDACVRIEYFVHCCYVSKGMWSPRIGDRLETILEKLYKHDRYTVVIVKNGSMVGHIPHEISKIRYFLTKQRWNY